MNSLLIPEQLHPYLHEKKEPIVEEGGLRMTQWGKFDHGIGLS